MSAVIPSSKQTPVARNGNTAPSIRGPLGGRQLAPSSYVAGRAQLIIHFTPVRRSFRVLKSRTPRLADHAINGTRTRGQRMEAGGGSARVLAVVVAAEGAEGEEQPPICCEVRVL